MAKSKDVANLLNEFHEKKILNLDASLRSVLKIEALDEIDPGAKVSTSVVAWDGYALVIKGEIASIAEVSALGQGIRQQLERPSFKPTTPGEGS
jgi:hypothetical protein